MKAQHEIKESRSIYMIYILLFALFLFKMFFYAYEINDYPDQEAQLSYVVYMEEHPLTMIPEFGKIKMTTAKEVRHEKDADKTGVTELKKETETCYLGHPPFYYQFLQMCDVVTIEQGHIDTDLIKIYHINIFITAFTMTILLCIGFWQLSKAHAHCAMHFMYVVICTSLPLYGYVGSGINNDNFCNLGMAVFLAGLLCYFEIGRCYRTYWLIAAGSLLCFFSKLTSGLIVFIVCAAMVLLEFWKNKNWKIICNPYFVSTLPCYLLIGSYFALLYAEYGTIQPTYAQFVSLEEFHSSPFYVEEALRTRLSFCEDSIHFFKGLLETWTGTYSKNYMVARTGILALPFIIVLCLFFCQAVYGLYCVRKNQNVTITILPFVFAVACIVTVLVQFASHRRSYLANGYLGGCQARYYMPCLPVVALGACDFIQRFCKDRIISVCVVFGGLFMIYADFFYYVFCYYRIPM